MTLIIETVPSLEEKERNLGRKRRMEAELGWDANADDIVEFVAGFLLSGGYHQVTICDSMRAYANERDPEDLEE
jgi:hypothetical protein